MADKERLVTIELLGQQYSFYTAASEEEVSAILGLVRPLVEGGGAPSGTLALGKVAVLACLNIASRYVQLEDEYAKYRANAERRISVLNDKINDELLYD